VIQQSPEQLLAGLVETRDAARQRALISSSNVSPTLALVQLLAQKVREYCPKDPALAQALAETSLYVASLVNTPVALAYATRSKAQALYTMRQSAEALPFFEQAADLFSSAGLAGEVGRTLVTQMDNLSYLGRYEEAIALEQRARQALEKEGDAQYLTNLEIGLGNLYYRLDQLSKSLAHYDRALAAGGAADSLAAAGMGRAHTLSDMNRFDEAVEAYETTKQHCERNGLTLWADIADRGIARMHFMRGNYSTALRMAEQLRRKHEAAADLRRVALCDLDRAEIYLQLNLFDEAASLVGKASRTFRRLGNRYEAAMCLMFLGIAEFKRLNDHGAEQAFLEAREMFTAEGNDVFEAAVDMWRAQLAIRDKRFEPARELAGRAAETFDGRHAPVRAASARLLAAQSCHGLGDMPAAMAEAGKALAGIEGFHAPWVSYQVYNTLGRLREICGLGDEAGECYLRAIRELESLRGNIHLDELQMSFGKDKYQVYENIVSLKFDRGEMAEAFSFVERSKSRTLIDLLERNLETVWEAAGGESAPARQVRRLREELNLLYNRLNDNAAAARRLEADRAIQEEIAIRERGMAELLRGLGTEKPGWASLQSMTPADVSAVQAMLDPDETLLEYYATGNRFHAFAISCDDITVARDIASTDEIRASLKGVAFQLSKFNLGASYLERHSAALLAAMKYHLGALHDRLVRPLQDFIGDRRSLTIVPHHALHYVPFHALYDGERFLIDTAEVSYAPSASVLKICRARMTAPGPRRDLVLAAPDERTPFIVDEVAALRQSMTDPRVFSGAEAGEDVLRRHAPEAGRIHIAAHGVFRADNPMFSSLKLGNTWLNLYDIFNLRLGADIVTLSACETGMNAVFEGDELLGLSRGFLYAGAPSLVVSLWVVNDRSTAQLMGRFYKGLAEGHSKRRALRDASLEVKADQPHPYYWAPFVLLGKP
jgi:CHAT domain-containing protein